MNISYVIQSQSHSSSSEIRMPSIYGIVKVR